MPNGTMPAEFRDPYDLAIDELDRLCFWADSHDEVRAYADGVKKALNHCVHLAHLAVSARESEAASNPVLPMAEGGKDAGLDLISGRVMGYLPLSRLVQIQPASGGPPLVLNNWPGAGEVNFNRFLGREVNLYLTRGPRPAILNVVAP